MKKALLLLLSGILVCHVAHAEMEVGPLTKNLQNEFAASGEFYFKYYDYRLSRMMETMKSFTKGGGLFGSTKEKDPEKIKPSAIIHLEKIVMPANIMGWEITREMVYRIAGSSLKMANITF